MKYLRRGHAIHFRCQHPEALRMRVDVISKMRGVDSFAGLWRRRTTLELPDGTKCDLLSLPDLVQAKKTQRDKDWPMIRRLVEAHYFAHRARAGAAQIRFWLRELRTPQLLMEVAKGRPALARQLAPGRPLLKHATAGKLRRLERALLAEENHVRAEDKAYWSPLLKELETLRHPK
jgi:hypothetical protein